MNTVQVSTITYLPTINIYRPSKIELRMVETNGYTVYTIVGYKDHRKGRSQGQAITIVLVTKTNRM